MHRAPLICLTVVTLLVLSALGTLCHKRSAFAAGPAEEKIQPAPVEESMHEFMEYVFQPVYKRLKAQIASAPKDNQAWKAIKSDALILAEGGNLLLIRQPEDKLEDWTNHSAKVRDLGGQLYQAAKKKDYGSARKQYELMLTNCNRCHQQFAEGKYQLEP